MCFKSSITLSIILLSSLFSWAQPSHEIWDKILNENVNSKGLFDYKNLQKNQEKLDQYLDLLSENAPKRSWEENDKLAYWINAYNAFTVKLILMNYPVKSIKDIGGSIYKVNTAWDIKFFKIGGKKYDLNNIEHGTIRKKFNEPRIHFAVNCASISCPVIRNEAYVGSKLNEQLDDQARIFLNDPSKNNITEDKIELSKLFSWFKGDFTKKMSLVEFINQYSKVKITEGSKMDNLDYDWNLNESK